MQCVDGTADDGDISTTVQLRLGKSKPTCLTFLTLPLVTVQCLRSDA